MKMDQTGHIIIERRENNERDTAENNGELKHRYEKSNFIKRKQEALKILKRRFCVLLKTLRFRN